jgi:hypothetical protein
MSRNPKKIKFENEIKHLDTLFLFLFLSTETKELLSICSPLVQAETIVSTNAWTKLRPTFGCSSLALKSKKSSFINSFSSSRQGRKRGRCGRRWWCRNKSTIWTLASGTITWVVSSFSTGFHCWWLWRHKLVITLSLTVLLFQLVVSSMVNKLRIIFFLIFVSQHFPFPDLFFPDFFTTPYKLSKSKLYIGTKGDNEWEDMSFLLMSICHKI